MPLLEGLVYPAPEMHGLILEHVEHETYRRTGAWLVENDSTNPDQRCEELSNIAWGQRAGTLQVDRAAARLDEAPFASLWNDGSYVITII